MDGEQRFANCDFLPHFSHSAAPDGEIDGIAGFLAARAELRQSEVLGRHAELLSNALYPNKVLQEREIGGIYFAARHGSQLLRDLYDTIRTDCLDHQIISL